MVKRVLIERTTTKKYGVVGSPETSAPQSQPVRVKEHHREVRPKSSLDILKRKKRPPHNDPEAFSRAIDPGA